MKTSDDALQLALYVNDCCNQELIFDVGDTFSRCPKCQRLCIWEVESTRRMSSLLSPMNTSSPVPQPDALSCRRRCATASVEFPSCVG